MSTTDRNSVAPRTIRIIRLALAAGRAGYSMTVRCRDFSPPLFTEVCRRLALEVGEGAAKYVAGTNDLRRLALSANQSEAPTTEGDKAANRSEAPTTEGDKAANRSSEKPRLIIVPDARLLAKLAWQTELGLLGATDNVPTRPTIVTIGSDEDNHEPGAMIDLYATPEEEEEILVWLRRLEGETGGDQAQPSFVKFPERLRRLCWPRPRGSDAAGLSNLVDCKVLEALLAGACILRNVTANTAEIRSENATLDVTIDDYTTVYKLLTCNVVRPTDRPLLLKAAAMIARANEYLAMQAAQLEKPPGADETPRNGLRPITRRELEALGDPKSKANQDLLVYLAEQPDGFSRFCTIGLIRPLSRKGGWPEPKTVEALAQRLIKWSYKEVRTEFDRLVTNKLIEADRRKANGPWVYTLPQDLTIRRSAFHNLPKPADIRAELEPGADAPKPTCLACPSVAQPAGQTEAPDAPPLTSTNGPVAQIFTE